MSFWKKSKLLFGALLMVNTCVSAKLPSSNAIGTPSAPEIITHNGVTYETVTSPHTGRVWLDRNLGASQVCTSNIDKACYGDYYQWGRDTDGHEKFDSDTTNTLATNIYYRDSTFIVGSNDWLSEGIGGNLEKDPRSNKWANIDGSSICPIGFRVPNKNEFEYELINTTTYPNRDTFFESFLKLPASAYRGDSGYFHTYGNPIFWTTSQWKSEFTQEYGLPYAVLAAYIGADFSTKNPSNGYPVRCIRAGQVEPSTFQFSYNLNKIEHTKGSSISNTFTIHLKNFKSFKDGNGDDLEDKLNVCDNYSFKVEDSEGHSATQVEIGCYYNDTDLFPDSLSINFEIDTVNTRQAYFENGNVLACRKDEATNCKTLNGIDDFTIYGTLFDLKKNAFSFKNSIWNKATFYDDFDGMQNDIAWAGSAVANYVPEKKKDGFWASIGYYTEDETLYFDNGSPSQGLCYGMAMSSTANFNKEDNEPWGIGGDIKKVWSTQITDHEAELKTKPKPFNTNAIYNHNKNDIEALKKIIYYHAHQGYYDNDDNDLWVGTSLVANLNDSINRFEGQKELKIGNVIGFSYRGCSRMCLECFGFYLD